MLDLKRLDVEATKDMCKLVSTLAKKPLQEMFQQIDGGSVRIANFRARKDFPDHWKKSFEDYIRTLGQREQKTIEAYYRNTVINRPRTFAEELSRWLHIDEVSAPADLAHILSSDRLIEYLVIRPTEENKFRAARMTVSFDPKTDLWPCFKTIRSSPYGKGEVLQGNIFSLAPYIYSIGRVTSRRGGIRIAKLRPHIRSKGPFGAPTAVDLLGLRLGHSKKFNLPFAHAVYAYHLPTMSQDDVDGLTGTMSLEEMHNSGIFKGDELTYIRDILTQNSMIDGGLLIEEMLGDGA